jgi:SAM-dependent methyltransferase
MESENLLSRATRRFGGVAREFVGKSGRLLYPRKDYVAYKGSLLPRPELRFNGPDQQDNEVLLRSAIAEAERVIGRLAYEPSQMLVDIGCGQGRLAIGLVRVLSAVRYLGVDVSADSIAWCTKHIEKIHPTYQFGSRCRFGMARPIWSICGAS